MTTSGDLFRREALEYRTRPQGSDGVVRVGAPWVRWLYWVVLVLVVAGLALAAVTRVERTASGPALVDLQAGTFTAVLPAAGGSELRDGRPVRLEVDGPAGRQDIAASVSHIEAADDADVRRAGFDSASQPAVLVTGVLARDAGASAETPSSRMTGRAVVELGSQRALPLFLQGFGGAPEGESG
ncbi:hypothetical protein [Blastococcus mobilis]|uniref:Uncharacterized protein n=1 Tax=Blastococcus mobilis TaxID=1938746 RepID=A0A238VK88_9ACTN|nr:hypothetical protein [Blastococcus mobilis]SNR34618.1 hypothetical protein SAMN06272737_103289 [Blastococcus mobilis]